MNDVRTEHVGQCEHQRRLNACKVVLADRETELLAIKGPCSNSTCRLHFAHSGPCDVTSIRGDKSGDEK